MSIENCGFAGKCMSSPQSYASSIRVGLATKKRVAEFALKALEEARQKDVAIHEANGPALENNRAIREQVTAFMKEIGIPDSYSAPKKGSRAMWPKSIRHDAGYIGDLVRHVPILDGFGAATNSYETLKARYEAYLAEGIKEAEFEATAYERAAERKRQERLANLEMASIILRYALPPDSEWSDILEALRYKDQRLDLAVAMADTRGDWSEGFYRVNSALGRFKIETDEDKDIANDIVSCLSEDDGRVFRDTTWNYGRLFTSAADQQLAKDVQTARDKARES